MYINYNMLYMYLHAYLSVSLSKYSDFCNINLTFLIRQDQISTKYLAHGTPLCILFLEPAASKEKCGMCTIST